MPDLGQPTPPLAASHGHRMVASLLAVASCGAATLMGAGCLIAGGFLAYAADRAVTAPARIALVLDMVAGPRSLIDDNLHFQAMRALLFFLPLGVSALALGAGAVLVAGGGRRKLTPWAKVDRAMAQFGSATVLVLGVGVLAIGVGATVAPPIWLVRSALLALGGSVVASALAVSLRPAWRDLKLLVAGLAALGLLSGGAVWADTTNRSTDPVILGGAAWSDSGFWVATPSAKPGAVSHYRAVTCSTPMSCIAWGIGPFGPSVWSTSSDGGATWQPALRFGRSALGQLGPIVVYVGISCWTSYCLAAGSPPAQSTDSGYRWQPLTLKGSAASSSFSRTADCFGPQRCLLAGYHAAGGPAVPVMVTDDMGRHWDKAHLPAGTWALDSVACTGPRHCIAVGSIGSQQSQAAVLGSGDGGLSWHRLPAPGGVGALTEVTCRTTTSCVAVGAPAATPGLTNAGSAGPLIFQTNDAGTTWIRASVPVLPGVAGTLGSNTDLACSGHRCMAVVTEVALLSGSSSLMTSTNYGRTWVLDNSPGALGNVAAGASINAVACGGEQVCVAVGDGDDGGVIFYSHDGGRTWGWAHGARGGPPWG